MKNNLQIEVCVESIDTVVEADRQGVDRIELCSALDLGGLTPSYAMIPQCRSIFSGELYVMIRPRPGTFVYSAAERAVMKKDIEVCARLGVDGVVFGGLTREGYPDEVLCTELLHAAKKAHLRATFHRAFDGVADVEKGLEQLIKWEFDRILTSGQAQVAVEGINLIGRMVQQSQGRIEIMAGGGVDAANAPELIQAGVDALHFSARIPKGVPLPLQMGKSYLPNKDKIHQMMLLKQQFPR